MKFPWANAGKLEEADIIFLGVPDESGSTAERKGASKAPDRIREVANKREVFRRRGAVSTALPSVCTLDSKIYDYGNVAKEKVAELVESLVQKEKMPVIVGGDHSITAQVLRGFDRAEKKLSVVYFDAHPDFICSTKEYYGSVVCDILDYKNIAFDRSIEVGVRNPEPEELVNLRRNKLKTISASEAAELGVEGVFREIKKRARAMVYVSIDMDVLDPAFAPGVTMPSPFGLSSFDLLMLLKRIAQLGILGMDVMEVCPSYDLNDSTSHLAARLVIETLSCLEGV